MELLIAREFVLLFTSFALFSVGSYLGGIIRYIFYFLGAMILIVILA